MTFQVFIDIFMVIVKSSVTQFCDDPLNCKTDAVDLQHQETQPAKRAEYNRTRRAQTNFKFSVERWPLAADSVRTFAEQKDSKSCRRFATKSLWLRHNNEHRACICKRVQRKQHEGAASVWCLSGFQVLVASPVSFQPPVAISRTSGNNPDLGKRLYQGA
jgi:hypothetical protein